MYYIVRVYDNVIYDRTFWDLDAAKEFIAGLNVFCELYLWQAGREEYMDNNKAQV